MKRLSENMKQMLVHACLYNNGKVTARNGARFYSGDNYNRRRDAAADAIESLSDDDFFANGPCLEMDGVGVYRVARLPEGLKAEIKQLQAGKVTGKKVEV